MPKKPQSETVTRTVYRGANGRFAPKKVTKLASTRNDRRRAQNAVAMKAKYEPTLEELPFKKPRTPRARTATLVKQPEPVYIPDWRLQAIAFGLGIAFGGVLTAITYTIAGVVGNLG